MVHKGNTQIKKIRDNVKNVSEIFFPKILLLYLILLERKQMQITDHFSILIAI